MKTTGVYPRLRADASNTIAIGHAGGVLLTDTIRATGLDTTLQAALSPFRKPFARHDPGKALLDLAVALALGGDTASDLATLRAEPGLYGPVASDPTLSRIIASLAERVGEVETAFWAATATARSRAYDLAGTASPDAGREARTPIVIDLDATLITAHSEKENAAPTFKRGFGFHPLTAFIDHGQAGGGEMAAIRLRPGNTGSNTVTDHIAVTKAALAQVPGINPARPGKSVLVRTDGAGGTHDYLAWLTKKRVSYSVGFPLPVTTPELYRLIPEEEWQAALDQDGEIRDGAGLAEFTGIMNLDGWPAGMRVIVRRERPHPGAQLRFGDVDGYRLTAFATNTARGQLQALERRHRQRARCEDRIREAKDTGLRNLPYKQFAQNRIWCLVVALASMITAWMGLLAHPGHEARRWEMKRLRHRLFALPALLARTGRRVWLRFSARSVWTPILTVAHDRLRALAHLPVPAQ